MYPADAYLKLLTIVRAGLLNIRSIKPLVFPLTSLPEAMDAAATADSLKCAVVTS
jgi:alcohol dehydrogenase